MAKRCFVVDEPDEISEVDVGGLHRMRAQRRAGVVVNPGQSVILDVTVVTQSADR